MDTTTKCAHPACKCNVPKEGQFGEFCSDHCRAAGDKTELRCECGHDGCK